MNEVKTNGFRMLPSYYEVIRELPDTERLQIYDAIMDYGFCNDIPELPPILNSFFKLIKPSLDKSIRFETKQKENGSKGGRPPKDKEKPNTNPTETQTEPTENLDIDIAVDNAVTVDNDIANEKSVRTQKRKYGAYGWVRLTDDQYNKLLDDLGASELERCIQYIDESAQQTGNKNKWRDWYLVLRKCSKGRWGLKQAFFENSREEVRVAWDGNGNK